MTNQVDYVVSMLPQNNKSPFQSQFSYATHLLRSQCFIIFGFQRWYVWGPFKLTINTNGTTSPPPPLPSSTNWSYLRFSSRQSWWPHWKFIGRRLTLRNVTGWEDKITSSDCILTSRSWYQFHTWYLHYQVENFFALNSILSSFSYFSVYNDIKTKYNVEEKRKYQSDNWANISNNVYSIHSHN